MPIELSGKYWLTAEIKEVSGLSASKFFRRLNETPGVLKLGSTYLIPDDVVPFFLNDEEKYSYQSKTVANICHSTKQLISEIIKCGFPATQKDGIFYIKKLHTSPLKKAIAEIRKRDGKASKLKAQEIADLAKKYLIEAKHD